MPLLPQGVLRAPQIVATAGSGSWFGRQEGSDLLDECRTVDRFGQEVVGAALRRPFNIAGFV